MNEAPPYAAFCVVCRRRRFLAVSRKDDPTDMNLPGGKAEPGEDGPTAGLRELLEEARLVGRVVGLLCRRPERHHSAVEAYLIEVDDDAEPVANEAGRVDWVTRGELLRGTYGEFNRMAIDAIPSLKRKIKRKAKRRN